MSDLVFREGDTLHLAVPEMVDISGFHSSGPIRTDVVTRPRPAETRCELATAGMTEVAWVVLGSWGSRSGAVGAVGPVAAVEPAGTYLCMDCLFDSMRETRERAADEASRTWHPLR